MKKRSNESVLSWVAWGWIGVLLLLGISENGIFRGIGIHSPATILAYEPRIVYSLFLTAAVLLWIGCHIYQKQFQLERRMIYAVVSFVLCIVYILSSFNAASPYLSQYSVLVSLLAVIFFIAGTFLVEHKRIIDNLPKVYLVFGYCIVIYGFLNLLGNEYLLDSLSFYEGIRITSIFQYANAYAVLLLTMWIVIVIEIIHSKNKYWQLLNGFMLVPVCVSFLLTLSRGAIILLPAIAVITLLLYKFKQQIMMVIYSLAGLGLSLLIYSHLEDAGTKVYENIQQARAQSIQFEKTSIFSMPSIGSWGLLVGVSVLMMLFTFVMIKYVEPKINTTYSNKWINWMLPISLVAICLVGVVAITSEWITQLLPDVIRTRVENVNFQTHSVYERLTMYKDSIEIWKQNPLIGLGGGGWEALYEQVQSYSYMSSQTHGFPAQLLVEVGLFGVIVYAGFILMVLWTFLRIYRNESEAGKYRLGFYLVVPITILIHSMIDFEMSYIIYTAIVFLCLGVLSGSQRQVIDLKFGKTALMKIRWSVSIVMIVLVIVILYFSGRNLYAINKYQEAESAIVGNQPMEIVVKTLEDGLSQSPGHPLVLHQLAAINYNAYSQTNQSEYMERAQQYVKALKDSEPNYRPLVELQYAILTNLGSRDESLEVLIDGIDRYPFDQSLYELAVNGLFIKWNELREIGESDAASIGKQLLELYQKMESREEMILELPDTINLIKKISVTNVVRLAAGRVAFDQKDYEQAKRILSPGIREDLSNEQDRQVARYYLAAMRNLGQDDRILFDNVIQAYPNEEAEINQLTNKN